MTYIEEPEPHFITLAKTILSECSGKLELQISSVLEEDQSYVYARLNLEGTAIVRFDVDFTSDDGIMTGQDFDYLFVTPCCGHPRLRAGSCRKCGKVTPFTFSDWWAVGSESREEFESVLCEAGVEVLTATLAADEIVTLLMDYAEVLKGSGKALPIAGAVRVC